MQMNIVYTLLLIRGARPFAIDVWVGLLYTRDMSLSALQLEGKMEPGMVFGHVRRT
jgi:hypothetical protein